ncbi:glycosyl hydrolase catalytic core-domain-containing protein [Mycena rosella]|uniref:Glycosyl hydrolase catalytic core-domain-containing protein n=1 Tax=Mycena rosella TaxID=1033263 RepID=A0AAD7GJX3_MYCRO|nr:glycosyl hydrolase catalytic core-domain-containing protein [Mycena rosella]
MVSARFVVSAAVALLAALPPVDATARGLAWATNNNFAPVIGSKPMVNWYHHWEDGPVPQMPAKNEYVPMFWGTSKWDKWSSRKAEMAKNTPKHLLGFNEPDISSQANMSPADAAGVWMSEIHPYAAKGVQLGSPAVAWNLDWTAQFLAELKKRGGHVDFITVHWYGSYQDLAKFKAFVTSAHTRFGYHIWVTELGVTSGSNPTTQQTKNFMMNAFSWMDSTGFVDRASWFGCFESSSPPDAYATAKNALFKTAGALNDMGFWYGYTSQPDRRDVIKARHNAVAARARDSETTDSGAEAVHCDDICKLRDAQMEAYEHDHPSPSADPAPVVANGETHEAEAEAASSD